MRILTIGTCRVYRSSFKMQQPGLEMFRFPHRIHTLRQTIQALRYMAGEPVLPDKLLHALSRRSCVILSSDAEPFAALNALRDGLPPLESYDRFIIEISSPKEHYATAAGGEEVLVNNLVAHDVVRLADNLEPHYKSGALTRLSDFRVAASDFDAIKQQMRSIKNRLQRPILWVPHGNIENPSPAEASLHRGRAKLARMLRDGARSIADDFCDPNSLGLKRTELFAARGRDLNHYTREGQIALAQAMLRCVAPELTLDGSDIEMPDDEED